MKLRTQLESLLWSQSSTAAQKLMSATPADDELHRIEQIQALLKVLPQRNTATIFVAIAVAVACLVAASLLWTIRLPTRVQMEVTTDSVTIGLAKGLIWSGNWDLSGGRLSIEGMSRIELSPEVSRATLSGGAWFAVRDGDFSLKHLKLQPKAELSIKKRVQNLSISSWNAPMLGQLEVFEKPENQDGHSPEQHGKISATSLDEIPGIVTFYHAKARTPAVLRVAPRGRLELPDVAIQTISFAREAATSDTSFRSGIISGKLIIPSTGEVVPLEPGSRLRLDGVEGIISKLTIGPDGATLAFEGKAKKVSIGSSGFERELQPSLLEYLYHQQRLGFFWTVLTVMWGVLWSARTLYFK